MLGKTKIAIIVAIANNNAIGKDGQLLIHLPADLKWFKKNTTGHTIVMGRKTFESLPNGALPNRKNVVLTRNEKFYADKCEIAHSIDELTEAIKNDEKVFVIGGAEIYKEFLPLADELIITRIYADFDADTFFPEIDFSRWKEIERIENKADEKNPVDFDFIIYKKNNKTE